MRLLSAINARDAEKILQDNVASLHALAEPERFLFFTAPVINPYAFPPPGIDMPPQALENGELKHDDAGFLRDELPTTCHSSTAMKHCRSFVSEEPNAAPQWTRRAKRLYRLIDSHNWQLANIIQYVDDRLAGELRQVQRMLLELTLGRYAASVFFEENNNDDEENSDQTIETWFVSESMVKTSALLLALITGSFAVAFGGVQEAHLPALDLDADGQADPKIFCKILAPAFVHLLDESQMQEDADAVQPGTKLTSVLMKSAQSLGNSRGSYKKSKKPRIF